MQFVQKHWPTFAVSLTLAVLLTVSLKPYGGNPTALFHMDQERAASYQVPDNFVVLAIPGYDGMQYYYMAKTMSQFFDPAFQENLQGNPTLSYSYQRFLLPFAAFLLSLGSDMLLPWAFLIINVGSLLLTCFLMGRYTDMWSHPLALALCPAALIGIHFSLAEPLTLLLFTLFLTRFIERERLDPLNLLLLSLLVLSREVLILFVGFLFAYSLWKKHYRDALLLLIPAAVFLALHAWIYATFGEIPFLMSSDKRDLPLVAIIELLGNFRSDNVYTLSSQALFLFFVLPATIWTASILWKERRLRFLPTATLAFLLLMLTMPDHIWGSITSIGRVITPVYPLFLFTAAERDTWPARSITIAILALGLAAGFGLAMIVHPYSLSL